MFSNNLEPSFFVWREALQKMYLIVKSCCMQSLFQWTSNKSPSFSFEHFLCHVEKNFHNSKLAFKNSFISIIPSLEPRTTQSWHRNIKLNPRSEYFNTFIWLIIFYISWFLRLKESPIYNEWTIDLLIAFFYKYQIMFFGHLRICLDVSCFGLFWAS